MSKFIVTFTPCFRKSVIKELCAINKEIIVEKTLSDAIILIQVNTSIEDFTQKIMSASPIFIKHLMPVMIEGKINGNLEDDKTIINNDLEKIVKLDKGQRFAVQCRIIAGGKQKLDYSSKDLEVFIGQNYEDKGGIPTFNDLAVQNIDIAIISILINKEDYYLGFSTSKENLNFSCDEYRIGSRESRKISRAENKLKEALVKFNVTLDGKGVALDIGAAPGGWTKVLVDYGYDVIAVDPGDLHPDLQNNPKIKHFKTRIENLEFENYFDIIVNDMNIDSQVTAQIMNSLSPMLKDEGICIVTLKLPNKSEDKIAESLAILSNCYDVLDTKSLFHNRQEVTTFIRKKFNKENDDK
jgi:23S rRNA (cytidine2498-2'-O)-methyltransferase